MVRQAPPTTIYAGFVPASNPATYEPPKQRRWPLVVAVVLLAAVAFTAVGALIARSEEHTSELQSHA